MVVAGIEILEACCYEAVLFTLAADDVPDRRITRSSFDSITLTAANST